MRIRAALSVVYVAAGLLSALAQTGESGKPPQQVQETPPDVKALREANRITDPEKKIAAIEKWKRDFPESQMQHAAVNAIFSTLVKKLPQQKARIRRFAADAVRHAEDKGDMAYDIADELLSADLLLKDADAYARRAVDSLRLATFSKEQIAGSQKRKQPPPSPSELEKRFQERRAPRLAIYGQIELKLGHAAKAKKLLEASYAGNPNSGAVLSALGDMAFKTGEEGKASDYLIGARLSGRATNDAKADLEAIYKKQHNGSLDGLESMLDAEYRKRYPNPVKVERYKSGEKRSDRVVLAEVFTGAGCPPCAGADVTFDAIMQRYDHRELAVLMYHVHVPRPDPMTNRDTTARAFGAYKVNGVPTVMVDGKENSGGGGTREHAANIYRKLNKDIDRDLEIAADAHLTAAASRIDQTIRVHGSVRVTTPDSRNLILHVALVEKDLRYNGENGIRFHPMVVRAVGSMDLNGESFDQLFDLNQVRAAIKSHLDDYESKGHRGEPFQFIEKKTGIDPNNLAVVAFLQDETSKHVLQAVYADVSAEADVSTEGNARQ